MTGSTVLAALRERVVDGLGLRRATGAAAVRGPWVAYRARVWRDGVLVREARHASDAAPPRVAAWLRADADADAVELEDAATGELRALATRECGL